MRTLLFALAVLAMPTLASAQYSGGVQQNEGPYGTGNNGWCVSRQGSSCTTGRQTQQAGTPNIAPLALPPGLLGAFGGGGWPLNIPLNPSPGPRIDPNSVIGQVLDALNKVGQSPSSGQQQTPRSEHALVVGVYDIYPNGMSTGGVSLHAIGTGAVRPLPDNTLDVLVALDGRSGRNHYKFSYLGPGQELDLGRTLRPGARYNNIAHRTFASAVQEVSAMSGRVQWINYQPPRPIFVARNFGQESARGTMVYDVAIFNAARQRYDWTYMFVLTAAN